MNLQRQLKTYLELRGMTATELARASGVSKQSISQWLGGTENIVGRLDANKASQHAF